MTEKDLKDALVGTIRNKIPAAVVLRHEDKNTAGIPDISVTYFGKTVWLEVKYAHPYVIGGGLQKLTCRRLAVQGICRYVIYEENKLNKRTVILHPQDIVVKLAEVPDECMSPGFNHEFVVQFIRRLCGDHDEQKYIPRDTRNSSREEGFASGDGKTKDD